jgi:SEC-C motif-containing protein
MRSRYSAYVKLLPTYLLRTWDPRTRPEDLTFEPGLRWTGLEVLGTEAGGEMDQFGTVEFLARHEIAGTPGALHEVSRFVRVDGRWAYLDGTH